MSPAIRVWALCAAGLACDAGWAADSQLARGEYLARAADCMSCHTAPGGPAYAGGAALDTPFGKIYPPNITPDVHDGIGAWTEADFVRALREGVRKDGALLYPAMPYPNYTKISDEDVAALWAYVRSVPASTHSPPANTLSFPFNVRPGLAVWQSLYFSPGRWQPVASHDATWNRGGYLVEALGHCDACHSPRNIAQATESKRHLTGAQIEGWYAPDIGSDPLSELHGWSTEALAAFLKTGRSPGNVKTSGPMQEVVHESLQYLSDEDLHAIAVYLKDQPQDAPMQAAAQPASRTTDDVQASLANGKAVYQEYCSSCHLSDGKGTKGVVPALAGDSALTAREPYNVIMPLLEGIPAQGVWGAMGSFARTLSDTQIADVTNYVRTAWGNDGAANATAWMVGNWRETANSASAKEPAALLCPVLTQELLRPAMKPGTQSLRQAARDPAKLAQLVDAYTSAEPNASTAQVIEALSTAYCRAIASDAVSQSVTGARIADFSQQVAVALTRSKSTATAR